MRNNIGQLSTGMSDWFASLVVAICCACGVTISTTQAGTIRDDRRDSLYTSLAANPAFLPVGKITWRESSQNLLASGTLIADQWVLTAAHVVDGTNGSGAGIIGLKFTLDAGQVISVEEAITHPNWIASGGEQDLFAGWDIGLARLAEPVFEVQPAALFTTTGELGHVATMVGFGATGTGFTGAQRNTAGTKRAGQNVVDIAGTLQTRGSILGIGHARLLAVDFDRPGVPSESTLGSAQPLHLEYTTAPGDSGGGLFIEVDGQQLLAGVTSLGSTLDLFANSDYGDRAAFTRVSQFVDWIDQTIRDHSPLVLAGDYNQDGVVNAADFTVWRDNIGAPAGALPNDTDGGEIDFAHYATWRANFGNALENGPAVATAVPEPTGLWLGFGASVIGLFSGRVKRLGQTNAGAFVTEVLIKPMSVDEAQVAGNFQ